MAACSELEGGASAAPPSATVKAPAAPPPVDRPPSVHGDPGLIAQSGSERSAYQAAFDTLKSGQYVESARQFQDFLAQYPNGSYAPNALYWLGESYYVTQNYELAQQQFQALLQRYPTHDKASAALLKLGLSQYGARQYDAASTRHRGHPAVSGQRCGDHGGGSLAGDPAREPAKIAG